MSDYTPTVNEVGYIYEIAVPDERSERSAGFDRMIAKVQREVAERCAVIAEKMTAPPYAGAYAGHLAAARRIRSEFPAPTPVTEENQA